MRICAFTPDNFHANPHQWHYAQNYVRELYNFTLQLSLVCPRG